jgi:hypothetical protein
MEKVRIMHGMKQENNNEKGEERACSDRYAQLALAESFVQVAGCVNYCKYHKAILTI